MGEWYSASLGNFVRFQKGVSYKGEYLDKPGLRLLGLGTIVPGGGIMLAAARQYCGPVKPHQQIQPGEVYVALTDITQDGRVLGSPALLPNNAHGRYAVTHHVAKAIIGRPDNLDKTFLYYLLQSEQARAYFRGVATGTTVRAVSAKDAENLEIQLPPLSEQRKIASILGALDDKIELNRRMNATLEAMARALFQSWFVDFDPVRAKAEGRQPVGMDAETAALFPDSFEDSVLGPIPKGWEAATWPTHMQILSGGTPKTDQPDYWDGDIPWYSVRDVPGDGQVWVLDTDKHITQHGLDASAARLLPALTTVISARGTVGKIALAGVPMAMNQSCYGMTGESGYDEYFTYYLLQNAVTELQRMAYGSVFDTITTETFKSLTVCFPPAKIGTTFNSFVKPIMLTMKRQLEQVMRLQAMRDLMLPKLLSGELRVRDFAA